MHVLVAVNARSSGARDTRDGWLRDIMASSGGVTLLGFQDGARLVEDSRVSGKEHFGFTDGASEPGALGADVVVPRRNVLEAERAVGGGGNAAAKLDDRDGRIADRLRLRVVDAAGDGCVLRERGRRKDENK